MNRCIRLSTIIALMIGFLSWIGFPQQAMAARFNSSSVLKSAPVVLAAVERRNAADDNLDEVYGNKIDLNNTNIRAFRQYRGLYPTLARILVENAPYDKVEDILEISELTERQREFLQANLNVFTVNRPVEAFVQGQDRINPGFYK